MPLTIGNNRIVPCPWVTINDDPILAGDQRRLGYNYTLTINGTLVAWKGSPCGTPSGIAGFGGPNGQFWQLGDPIPDESISWDHHLFNIFSKQTALEALFATDGQWLEFSSPDGSLPIKGQFKNAKITFDQDIWFNTCRYTIICECDILYLNGEIYKGLSFPELIQSANESWQVQEGEIKKTFNVVHNISAVGKRTFDAAGTESSGYPWQIAKNFVWNRLGLGYSTTAVMSTLAGQTIVNQGGMNTGRINFTTLSPHNFSRSENVDELAGSYSLTENWTLAAGSGTDVYTIAVQQISDDPLTTTTASIQGRVIGFYDQLFDYDVKIANAQYMMAKLQQDNTLYQRVTNYVNSVSSTTGVVFNQQPVHASIDLDPINGSIDYNYQFTNTAYQGDAFETYTIEKSRAPDDYKTTFTVNGNIRGRRYVTDTDPTAAYGRAQTYFNTIIDPPVIFNRIILPQYFPEASSLGVRIYPLSKTFNENRPDGTISYSFIFDNRVNDSNVSSDFVKEDYNLNSSFSREDGKTTYSINGTILGLNLDDTTTREVRFANASGYWSYNVLPNLYNRISSYYGITLPNPLALTKGIAYNKNAGSVTYDFSWNDRPAPIISGALSEIITVSQQNPGGTVQVIAAIPILGRGILGPILQDINTTVEKTRTINIETIMKPTGSRDFLASFNLKPNYDMYITGIAPQGGRVREDNESWSWEAAHYSRTVTWIFQTPGG